MTINNVKVVVVLTFIVSFGTNLILKEHDIQFSSALITSSNLILEEHTRLSSDGSIAVHESISGLVLVSVFVKEINRKSSR